jgi:hypothetical protein
MEFLILAFFFHPTLHSPFVLWIILFETNEGQGVNTHLIYVKSTILNGWIQHHQICVFEF